MNWLKKVWMLTFPEDNLDIVAVQIGHGNVILVGVGPEEGEGSVVDGEGVGPPEGLVENNPGGRTVHACLAYVSIGPPVTPVEVPKPHSKKKKKSKNINIEKISFLNINILTYVNIFSQNTIIIK